MPKIYIGTSGWSYQHWHEGIFYPPDLKKGKELEYYTKYFKSVELNASFYRLPQAKTFENWQKRTPKDFVFALKASRFITHIKKLKGIGEPWELFLQRALLLKEKLGPILFQLPPSLKFDQETLEEFLKIIIKKAEKLKAHNLCFALEARHQTWFSQECFNLLRTYNVAFVYADSGRWPKLEKDTADFFYLRMHGPGGLYASDYQEEALKEFAKIIKRFLNKGKDVYCYFNNDYAGYAVRNALRLKEILGG